jgi:hypothetical protein
MADHFVAVRCRSGVGRHLAGMKQITQARLRHLLDYAPASGAFTRCVDVGGGNFAGKVAGTVSGTEKKRFRQIWIDGRSYASHRLAWLWMTGELPAKQINHKNGDLLDNRWENLRLATNSQNCMNRTGWGASGAKGVYFRSARKSDRQWRAIITFHGNRKHLGYFETFEEASSAYIAAAKIFHGEFARVA